MIAAILSGYISSLAILAFGKYVKNKFNFIYTLLPLFLFIFFASFIPSINQYTALFFKKEWVPTMGINLDFKLDGLSLLFSLLITGIGTLVFLYAHKYLYGHKYISRFFAYLSIFMASMLGLVLSDNVISLFIFWELTSISSFFLIGFNNENEASRKNAQLSLAITGLGGFFLLGGFILLGLVNGNYSIQDMLTNSAAIKDSSLYGVIIVFIFLGAFTKSAQFPFHFWLPKAMQAPTPVSAYLHSATMVKAGIYLLARFTPILGGTPYWNYTLMIVGGVTMLFAATNALFKTDLKGVLAYSTIAVLGMLTLMIGIGTPLALKAAVTFIVAHALYKAALFLITGIIDHEAHTRDITLLSGLRKVMPIVFVAGFMVACSNAGIPFTFGFIGKEIIYEAALGQSIQWITITSVTMLVISNIFIGYAGYQVGMKPFIGVLPEKYQKIKPVSIYLFLPPLLLATASVFYGIVPIIADNILINSAAEDIVRTTIQQPLKIWHGFNLTLLLSVATIILGLLLFYFRKITHAQEEAILKLSSISNESSYYKFKAKGKKFAEIYTKSLHNGYLRIYIITIILFTIGIVGYKFIADVPIRINTNLLSTFRLYELVIFGIIVVAILFAVFATNRLAAIASMSIVGYCICLLFVFYGAPDLAMTQFTIDTLTLVLFMLVLFKLPPFMKYANTKILIRDGIISIAFGTLIALITLQALVYPADKEISRFYAENAYLMAKGKNVVNVILVDFRGFDTMIESLVLTIAALGVYGLLKLEVKSSDKE